MSHEILPAGVEDFEEAFDLGGVRVNMYISPIDGTPVIDIETEGAGWGRVRINLNDGAIWDGNPETHDHDTCDCIDKLADYIKEND